MAAYSYTNFLAYVKLRLGQRTDLESVGGTNMYGVWVNSAYRKICTMDKLFAAKKYPFFPQLETSSTATTVDGTAYVSVPSDALIIRTVYNGTDNVKLDGITWGKYAGYTDKSSSDAESAPTEWTRAGTYIYLHPTPDAAYSMTIYYRKIPTALSSGDDVTLLGVEWDDPIVSLATYIGYQYLGEFDKAKIVMTEFTDSMVNLIDIYKQEEKDRNETMAPSILGRTA